MHEKVFESLDAINKEVEKCYQNLRKECKTYKELEKVINDIVWHKRICFSKKRPLKKE